MTIPFHDFGGTGSILHFAHANGFPPESYRSFVAGLLPTCRVLGIRQRPLWPNSQPEELDSWEILANDLIHFLDQEGLEGVIGVGHSVGAVATMIAAQKRPLLFSKLILIEPVFLLPSLLKMITGNSEAAFHLPLVKTTLRRRTRWASRQDAFDGFRSKPFFKRWSDEALWEYINVGLHEDNDGVSLTYSREWEARIYARPPTMVWDYIPHISHPTLAFRGVDSDTIMPQVWDLWQEQQPQATFVEMAEVGHMIPMERPLPLAKLMLDWVKNS